MTDYTDGLGDAIRHMHGCEASHVESVPVHETFQGRVVWDGTVEVFDLQGAKGKFVLLWITDVGTTRCGSIGTCTEISEVTVLGS